MACVLVLLASVGTATAEDVRQQLWRGLWISLPKDTEVTKQIPGPVPWVRKSAYFDGVTIELVKQKTGLPYGAKIERRLRLQDGERDVTVREQGGSYWISSVYRGQWEFTRKIRLSRTSMIKATFSVPASQRHSKETRSKRAIVMSISPRKS